MKKLFLSVSAVAVLLAVAAPAPAQAGVGFYGSWWHGADLADGFGVGGKAKINLIPIIDLEARLGYVKFNEVDMYSVPAELAASLDLSLLYGGLGLGYYFFGADEDGVTAKSNVGGFAFLGLKIAIAGFGVFGELKYTVADTEKGGSELDADGFGANAGVLLAW